MSMQEIRQKGDNFPYIIAVDFDGTLVKDKFPMIGEPKPEIWDKIMADQKGGAKIILWTCRNGDFLKQAVDFCADKGLHFDAINENLDEVKILYGGDTRKIFADIYVDDRCGMLGLSGNFERFGPTEV